MPTDNNPIPVPNMPSVAPTPAPVSPIPMTTPTSATVPTPVSVPPVTPTPAPAAPAPTPAPAAAPAPTMPVTPSVPVAAPAVASPGVSPLQAARSNLSNLGLTPSAAPTPAPTAPASTSMPSPAGTSAPTPMPAGTSVSSTLPTVPSVAPRAPGAELQPVAPIADAPEPTQPEKKVDVVMIVLGVILVILVVIAGYLWWMNLNGKSIFAPKTSEPVVVESSPSPASVSEASDSSLLVEETMAIDKDDICYVDPNLDGDQEEVEDFLQWQSEKFEDVEDTEGEYKWLFDYYIDRALMAPEICHSHQQYCHLNFAAKPEFAAQFTHYNYQRSLEAQNEAVDYEAYIPVSELQKSILIDFNLNGVDFGDAQLGVGTKAPNGWVYNRANDSLLTFGVYEEPQPEYIYRFVKAKTLPGTQKVVLIGQGYASASCKETNNCVCEASQIYVLMDVGSTGNLYFSDVFIEPLVGRFAQVGL